jgi:F-type H+-transporting ATPase subunit b
MLRRAALAIALVTMPAAAGADTMPQMDFHNPLTTSQIVWMAVILVALYLILSRWGLPGIGGVLERRAGVISTDLEAARAAKAAADEAVRQMDSTLRQARVKAQVEIADAIAAAKAKAAADAAAANARLDAQVAEAEAQIAAARAAAMAALKPVAEATASALLTRLTGAKPEPEAVGQQVDAALAARQAA